MSFYENRIFPWITDKLMSDPELERLRREVLARARGRVIEIGFGTGLNLPCYPPAVERVVGVDPNPGMNRRAELRARDAAFPVEVRALAGESLPMEDASADTVVCTFALCTIDDVQAALREIRRVLAPGGSLLVLEHGLHPRPGIQVWQRRFNPLQQVVACGCRLDRDIQALVTGAGFRFTWLENRQAEAMPTTHGYLYLGEAQAA